MRAGRADGPLEPNDPLEGEGSGVRLAVGYGVGVGVAAGVTDIVSEVGTTGALIGWPASSSRAATLTDMEALPVPVPCSVRLASTILAAPAETMSVRSTAVRVTDGAGSTAGWVWFRSKTG